MSVTTKIIFTLLAVAPAVAEEAGQPLEVVAAPAPGPAVSSRSSHPGCAELCQHATGVGADDCMTDCRVATDTSDDDDGGIRTFVEDETYNAPGSNRKMAGAYEAVYGEKAPECSPTWTKEEDPSFEDVDLNGDGVLEADEVLSIGEAMCIPDKVTMQMFWQADKNRNKVLTRDEYNRLGEDTLLEKHMDAPLDENHGNPHEFQEFKVPDFEVFDKNSDGVISADELEEVLTMELLRRYPEATKEEIMEKIDAHEKDLDDILNKLDTNGDGVINKSEWAAVPSDADDGDMGSELGEHAEHNHTQQDPDSPLWILPHVSTPTVHPPPPGYYVFPEKSPSPAIGPAVTIDTVATAPAPAMLLHHRRARRAASHGLLRRSRHRRGSPSEEMARAWPAAPRHLSPTAYRHLVRSRDPAEEVVRAWPTAPKHLSPEAYRHLARSGGSTREFYRRLIRSNRPVMEMARQVRSSSPEAEVAQAWPAAPKHLSPEAYRLLAHSRSPAAEIAQAWPAAPKHFSPEAYRRLARRGAAADDLGTAIYRVADAHHLLLMRDRRYRKAAQRGRARPSGGVASWRRLLRSVARRRHGAPREAQE